MDNSVKKIRFCTDQNVGSEELEGSIYSPQNASLMSVLTLIWTWSLTSSIQGDFQKQQAQLSPLDLGLFLLCDLSFIERSPIKEVSDTENSKILLRNNE